MEYKNNKSFLNAVKNNDLQMVKSQLSEMIMLYQGSESEIMQAVQYAENNCSFKFEEHKQSDMQVDKSSNSDLFYTEKVQLRNNFSKHRFDEVIRLYPLMVKEDDFFADEAKKPNDNINNQAIFKNKTKTYFLLGASFILAAYIIYKILK
jgi:hypothetical protein